MQPGKTAFMPFFYGKGCTEWSKKIPALVKRGIRCPNTHGGAQTLLVCRSYKHMGVRCSPDGSILPEIAARYSTMREAYCRVRSRFFECPSVDVQSKLHVVSALMLSRQFNAAGAWPCLRSNERQRIHSNVMRVFRSAVGEDYDEDSNTRLTDSQVLGVHSIRAPYSFVRFARLRLSVRLVHRAPIQLLALIESARGGERSWLSAVEDDLAWLSFCVEDTKFSLQAWFEKCRIEPGAARALVRKACDSEQARSLSLAELKPSVARLEGQYTCFCGASLKSVTALASHKFSKHGIGNPIAKYATPDNHCMTCLLVFDNRTLLINHLVASRICSLNMLLRVPPLSIEEDEEARADASTVVRSRNKAGVAPSKAIQAVFRMHGPIWRLVDLDGNHVPWTSSCHPCGRGRGKRHFLPDPENGVEAPFEVDELDCFQDEEDVMLADLEIASLDGSEDIMIADL